jgi:hypothetical protein
VEEVVENGMVDTVSLVDQAVAVEEDFIIQDQEYQDKEILEEDQIGLELEVVEEKVMLEIIHQTILQEDLEEMV